MSPVMSSPGWRRTRSSRFVTLAVAALFAVHAGAAYAATQPYGGESPEAVVERVRAAAENEDLGEMAACLSPSDRSTLSLTMVMMTGMVVAFASMGAEMGAGMAEGMAEAFEDEEMSDEAKRERDAEMAAQRDEAAAGVAAITGEYEAILERHGLMELMSDDDAMDDADPAAMLAGVDQVALLQDLMGFLDAMPGESEEGEEGDGGGGDSPVDVPHGELTGLAVDGDHATGKLGDEDVEFVKVDGRWYLSLDLAEKMRQEAGGMDMDDEMDMEMDDEETDDGDAIAPEDAGVS